MGRVTYRLETVKRRIHNNSGENDILVGASIPQTLRAITVKLAQVKAIKDKRAMLKYTEELLELFGRTEDWAQVAKYSREVQELAFALKEPLKEAKAYQQLSLASSKLGIYTEAILYAQNWLSKSKEAKSEVDELEALLELAVYHINQGESLDEVEISKRAHFDNAQLLLRDAAGLVKRSKDISLEQKLRGRAMIAMNLGIVYKSSAAPDKGIAAIQRSLQIFSQIGDIQQQANAFFNLATCFDVKLDYAQALKFGKQEQELFHKLGDIDGELKSLWDNCYRLRKLGQFVERKIALEKYKEISKKYNYAEELEQCQDALESAKRDIELSKKLAPLSRTILDAQLKNEYRRQYISLSEKASINMELGLITDEVVDLKALLSLSITLKESANHINKIRYRLGEAYFNLSQWESAQTYYREFMKYDDVDSCDPITLNAMWKLIQAMTNGGSTFQILRKLHSDAFDLAERLKDVEMQLKILESLRHLCQRFNFIDQVKFLTAQIEYLSSRTRLQSSNPSSATDDLGSQDSEDFEQIDSQSFECSSANRQILSCNSHTSDCSKQNITTTSSSKRLRDHPKPIKTINASKGIVDLVSSPIDTTNATTSNPLYLEAHQQLLDDSDDSDHSGPVVPLQRGRTRKRILAESMSENSDIFSGKASISLPKTTHQCTDHIYESSTTLNSLELLSSTGMHSKTNPETVTVHLPPINTQMICSSPISTAHTASSLNSPSVHCLTPRQSTAVQIEFPHSHTSPKLLEIECASGPSGTPRTVGWVIAEARRRYLHAFDGQPPKFQLAMKGSKDTSEKLLAERETVLDLSSDRLLRLKAILLPAASI
ncbi:hypothetical protein QVD99_006484 [Batrachochytrium dendrobatidis]|nr:hypothetical protein QVD99_006484 [Batrachochytrium dendrobatidis]